MQYCIIVASLCSVIGPESSRHFLNQSDTKLKTNRHLVTRVFPRFGHFAFTFNFHWL